MSCYVYTSTVKFNCTYFRNATTLITYTSVHKLDYKREHGNINFDSKLISFYFTYIHTSKLQLIIHTEIFMEHKLLHV